LALHIMLHALIHISIMVLLNANTDTLLKLAFLS
jgi:hypothetical protein